MEHEERSGKLAKYVERRRGDVFEVMAYSGTMTVKEDWIERIRKPHPELPRYQRCLIIPLPLDFDWSKLSDFNPPKQPPHLPNGIIIIECEERWKRKGRKHIRPLTAFLDKPGSTTVKEVVWTGGIGGRAKVWISEKKFKEITKRNLYVDKYYAEPIFNRGKNSSGL